LVRERLSLYRLNVQGLRIATAVKRFIVRADEKLTY
jgi:hypothetical protein